MKLKLHFAILALIAFSFTSIAQVSENEAAARQWIKANATDLKIKPTDDFTLSFVFKGEAGEVLRFQQMKNNVPVYQSEIIVNFNISNELVFTATESFDNTIENISTIPVIAKNDALNLSLQNLKYPGEYSVSENKLYVKNFNNQTKCTTILQLITWSRPIPEVNRYEAFLVLRWGTAWDLRVLYASFFHQNFRLSNKFLESVSFLFCFFCGIFLIYHFFGFF